MHNYCSYKSKIYPDQYCILRYPKPYLVNLFLACGQHACREIVSTDIRSFFDLLAIVCIPLQYYSHCPACRE